MIKTKKYLILDTNNFICFFEMGFSIAQQQKGILSSPEEITVLEQLFEALNTNSINLILPEIVTIESERIKEERKADLRTIHDDALARVKESVIHNKRISVKSITKISKTLEAIYKEDIESIDTAWKLFEQIKNHKNTHVIKLNLHILLEAYKRGLMGKKPFAIIHSYSKESEFNNKPIHDIQPDCVIIESVRLFLNKKRNFELYLCTNDSHFYTSLEKKEIDAEIQKELTLKGSFTTLSDFLTEILGVKKLPAKMETNEPSIDAFPQVTTGTANVENAGNNIQIVKG